MSREPSSPPLGLPTVGAVDGLPSEALPALIAELAALQARAAARLLVDAPSTATGCLPDRRPADEPREVGADEYLTTAEAAALLRVSRRWLYRRAGRLPFARKLSRRELRFSRQGLERYMATRGT
jgi:excisionase family DNA binding protein